MRIRRLVIAACLVGSSLALAGPAQGSGGSVKPIALATLDASYGACQDPFPEHYFTGSQYGWSGSYGGVGANIDTTSDFRVCTQFTANDDGSSAWVAKGGATGDEIVQLGVIHCRSFPGRDACPVSDQLRFFWAYGGCGYLPFAQDLGAATYGNHLYQIIQNTNWGYNDIHLLIDGVVKKALPHQSTHLSCWWGDNAHNTAEWLGERWDRGDGLGAANTPLQFWQMQVFWLPTSLWGNVNANCSWHDANSSCSIPSAATQYLWTTN